MKRLIDANTINYKDVIGGESEFAHDIRKAMHDLIQQQPTIEIQKEKWIPVSERLPEEETDVLICNSNGDVQISRGSYSTEIENDFIWYTSGWRFGRVIAWMPLPEPYKAESEAEE